MAELDLDYDYLAKLVRKTQTGDSNAFAELYTATYQSSIVLHISMSKIHTLLRTFYKMFIFSY